MHALKYSEQFAGIFHVKARSVITHKEHGLALHLCLADLDDRHGARAATPHYRAEQVLRTVINITRRALLPDVELWGFAGGKPCRLAKRAFDSLGSQ
jgi:hypothetical protein